MGKMTVNQIRERLGKIVLNIFTADYAKRYEKASSRINAFSLQNSDEMRLLILNLSENLNFPSKIKKSLNESSDKSIVLLFLIYHQITQLLVEKNQNETVIVSDDDSLFFRQMFSEFWLDGIST